MKKIFTLLFSTLMLSTAFAQHGQQNRGDIKSNDIYASNNSNSFENGNKGYHDWYIFTEREKNIQIAQINRNFAYKIQSVQNRAFMSRFQKRRLIANLEVERDQELRAVFMKFNSPANRFGDYGKKYKKDKKNRW